MKKQTAVFIISALAISAVLQAVFASYFIRTADLNRFIYIRKMVEKNARLCQAGADSYMEFKAGPGTAILAIPSCDLNMTLIPGKYDFFIMHADKGTSVFSIYPSPVSARKHNSLYMKGTGTIEYTFAGSLFGFKCGINGAGYGRSFYINPDCRLLPSDAWVF